MNDLLKNIDRIHTTKLGIERIKKNLKLEIEDVVTYCKNIIINKDCIINKKGKNYYCKFKNTTITINSYSYTIITAHKGE
jgi:hypothetical protein